MLRGARVGTHANVVHSKFVIQKMLTPAETRVSSTCLALESRHISVPLSVFKQRVVHKARIPMQQRHVKATLSSRELGPVVRWSTKTS